MEQCTQVPKNYHNSVCDRYFHLKPVPLYSTQKGLFTHALAKDSMLMKNPEWSLLSEQVACYCYVNNIIVVCFLCSHILV